MGQERLKMPLSKEDIDDIKVGRALQTMMATEGWQHYTRLLNSKIADQVSRILRPFSIEQSEKATAQVLYSAVDHFVSSESIKGAIMGLKLASTLPAGIISNMEDLLSRAKAGSEVEDVE